MSEERARELIFSLTQEQKETLLEFLKRLCCSKGDNLGG